MAVKTWFITGTSRGFGREWAIAALDRGDMVAATARDIASLDDLAAKYGDAILPIRLDVTDRGADFAAVKLAHDYFGRLDVVVNNAGYGQFGMVEEISESEIRGAAGNEPARRAVGHPGGAALSAGARQRAYRAGVLDRRDLGVHEYRRLPRVQMGAGRAEPEPGSRGGRVRRQGHADRAVRLLHRLGRPVGEARGGAARPTNRSGSRPRRPEPGASGPATRARPARRC